LKKRILSEREDKSKKTKLKKAEGKRKKAKVSWKPEASSLSPFALCLTFALCLFPFAFF
jgi:hypothetical protein